MQRGASYIETGPSTQTIHWLCSPEYSCLGKKRINLGSLFLDQKLNGVTHDWSMDLRFEIDILHIKKMINLLYIGYMYMAHSESCQGTIHHFTIHDLLTQKWHLNVLIIRNYIGFYHIQIHEKASTNVVIALKNKIFLHITGWTHTLPFKRRFSTHTAPDISTVVPQFSWSQIQACYQQVQCLSQSLTCFFSQFPWPIDSIEPVFY